MSVYWEAADRFCCSKWYENLLKNIKRMKRSAFNPGYNLKSLDILLTNLSPFFCFFCFSPFDMYQFGKIRQHCWKEPNFKVM